ncbi:MAG: hypothetical protein IPM53_07235 [Anaerolineaceae bacterium]|nr:hypothetical protein [Anaerolineaceae bacterium]
MQTQLILLLFWSLLSLAACTPPTEEAAPATAVAVTTSEATAEAALDPVICDPISADGQLFTSEEGGYCLIYPPTYCWLPGQDALTHTFVSMDPVDETTNRCTDDTLILHGEVVWLQVKVSPAEGQPLEELVAGYRANEELFGLEFAEVVLDGETAVQINNMPGQDISRVLFAVHNDQFYELTFVPAAADRLYAQVLETFRFLP